MLILRYVVILSYFLFNLSSGYCSTDDEAQHLNASLTVRSHTDRSFYEEELNNPGGTGAAAFSIYGSDRAALHNTRWSCSKKAMVIGIPIAIMMVVTGVVMQQLGFFDHPAGPSNASVPTLSPTLVPTSVLTTLASTTLTSTTTTLASTTLTSTTTILAPTTITSTTTTPVPTTVPTSAPTPPPTSAPPAGCAACVAAGNAASSCYYSPASDEQCGCVGTWCSVGSGSIPGGCAIAPSYETQVMCGYFLLPYISGSPAGSYCVAYPPAQQDTWYCTPTDYGTGERLPALACVPTVLIN